MGVVRSKSPLERGGGHVAPPRGPGYGPAVKQIVSLLRIAAGLLCLAVLVGGTAPILVVLIPWRVARIRVTNVLGTLVGRSIMWCSGCRITVEGLEHIDAGRPAIYAANHTTIFDAFTTIWLTPSGTVGVAKKEVLLYPFYGQIWWLAGHVFLDRGRTERAKRSVRRAAEFIGRNRLHLCILPEGTRSARLGPFKKGIAHVALMTGLPIVPMVTIGAQNVWRKGSLLIEPAPILIRFLPPVSTKDWTEDNLDEHIDALRQVFLEALPPEQRDRSSDAKTVASAAGGR